jgi:Polysaccharide deacetylase
MFVISRQLDDPRKRELLQAAVREGFEIASHTVTHRFLTELASAEKRREIFDSRERLGSVLGVTPQGFRAPAFRIDRESLELLAEAGYAYDSSMFPTATFARRANVEKAWNSPARPLEGRSLTELWLPSPAPLPFPFHPCYSLVLGMPYYRLALRRFCSRGLPLVFLFHLTDFADPLPETHLNGRKDRFFTLSYLSAEQKRRCCQKMLDAVREHFRIMTTADFLKDAAAGKNHYGCQTGS